ncbi:DUF2273 domain-containing protein [Pectinatus brassicae]|uniref:Putative membrane protein n=1 Tax=Pectinatus brassicae TaxID=862415 RepID=A0A840UNV6_9FIRM|nr:DUF2273 domain-containing protein [Pectinatus brassicae]MBB5336388.1 putative membrane protein [Pectinatus brassicae]
MDNFSWKKCITNLWQNHRAKTIGFSLGFIISVAILVFGFFKTLFVIIFTGAGLFIGNKIDKNDDLSDVAENFLDIVQKIIPPIFRR